jgi:uncharacterized Zn-binding protein involved in type VI secretion
MPPAARITDLHTCPRPGHDGGPVIAGEPTVLIGFQPAARVGDQLSCDPGPDSIAQGEPSVLIGHSPAARIGDPTSHGGKIVAGCPTVIIGADAQVAVLKTDRPFCEDCARTRHRHAAAARVKASTSAVARANAGTGPHPGPPETQPKPAAAPAVLQQSTPCDFDIVEVKCKHCGLDRKIAGVKFQLDAHGKPQGDHVRPTNKRRPFLPDRFEVVAADDLTIKISGGPGYHDSRHPMITLTPPAEIGPPVVVHGKTSHVFKVTYTKDWFEKRLKASKGLDFSAELKQFFYPEPVVYGLRVEACGSRKQGAPFVALAQALYVYPDDIFKISLTLPSFKKVEKQSFSGREGDSRAVDKSHAVSDFRGNSHTKADELRTGGATPSYAIKEKVVDPRGGVEQAEKVVQGKDGALAHTDDYKASRASDATATAAAKSVKITRDSCDVTRSFKIGELLDFIADLRTKCMDVVDFIRALVAKSPKIGWSFSFTLELLSGTLEYSWGYKEWSKDHTVYRYWKIEAALTVISCKLELAFGVTLLKAKAQVYGCLSGDLKVSAAKEADLDGSGASVSATLTPGGEIGVRGALGDWIEVVGKVNAGFEGSTKMEFSPFKWTFKIDLAEGKGTFVAKSKFGLNYEAKATLWDKRPVLAERTIIG